MLECADTSWNGVNVPFTRTMYPDLPVQHRLIHVSTSRDRKELLRECKTLSAWERKMYIPAIPSPKPFNAHLEMQQAVARLGKLHILTLPLNDIGSKYMVPLEVFDLLLLYDEGEDFVTLYVSEQDRLLPFEINGSHRIPLFIYFTENGIKFGQEAQREYKKNPQNGRTLFDFLYLISLITDKPLYNFPVDLTVYRREFTFEVETAFGRRILRSTSIVSFFLLIIKHHFEHTLRRNLDSLVFWTPTGYNDRLHAAFKYACRQANIQCMRLQQR